MATPTSRSLAECKRRDWPAYVVEKHNTFTHKKKDAFGFGDVLVMDGAPGSLLLQVTGDNGGHMAERVAKITGECRDMAKRWLEAGNRIQVWGYGKRVHKFKNGNKAMWWKLREVAVTLEDFV